MERLKRRSASARWDELRQTWRFDHPQSEPASSANQPQSSDDWSDASAFDDAAEPVEVNAGSAPSTSMATEATPFAPSPSNDVQVGFDDPEGFDFSEDLEMESASEVPALPSPAAPPQSAFPPQRARQRSFVAQEDLEENGGLQDPSLEGIATRNILPKPITSILPYHDYAPNGEDPCEYLCPRPADCPEDDKSKPCPEIVSMPDVGPGGRYFVDMPVLWEPSNLFHNPLYFEDPALERYGHTHNPVLQPFVSAGKFGAQLIGLPYQMALHPVCEEQYTLGWHRPGECVPYRYYFPPWNTKAAAVAGGVYTGLIFLIP